MRFIALKPIIIRDAFYSSINRRTLVPTLCAAVGECPTSMRFNSHNQSWFRAMQVIWSRGRSVPPLHPTGSGHGVEPGLSA